ncbi:hypothetical protein FHY71_18345 [Bacillus tropicus]|uniref:Uncharacterized protein n=1 Tax=Bacillus tropicus TaxID=2026188 RepID=A0A5C5A3Q1_9BACI|nr:hypothetical protein BTXL6_22700 [Bacillus thuringiensis]PJZ18187.1 hypothetical protein CEW46_30040 [Bacillus cereus]TNP13508.1 hypothetical protein FHY71_18345 [Bacillus tropicus]
MGDGRGLNEMLFLVFNSKVKICCVNGEEFLLFFQFLNDVGVDECKTLGNWKKNKTSRTTIEA